MSHNVKRYTKEEAEKFGVVKPNEIRTFHHMYVSIPTEFINKSITHTKPNYKDDIDRDSAMTHDSNFDIAFIREGKVNSGTEQNIMRRIMFK
jgi:hypothetical protein